MNNNSRHQTSPKTALTITAVQNTSGLGSLCTAHNSMCFHCMKRQEDRKNTACLHPITKPQKDCSLRREFFFHFGLTPIYLRGFRVVFEGLRKSCICCYLAVEIEVF